MNKINWKDIAQRVIRTFIQAAIPILIATLATLDITDMSNLKAVVVSAGLSACSAGLSAVWNIVTSLVNSKIELDDVLDDEE